MSTHDIEELKAKQICCQCVGEAYLSREIEHEGAEAQCSYCGETERCISVDELSDRIENGFENHYTRTSDQPDSWQQSMLSDRESDYNMWFRDGDSVLDAIEAAAEIPAEAAAEVQAVLDDRHADIEAAKMGDETEFSSETHYEERGASDRAWQEEWRGGDGVPQRQEIEARSGSATEDGWEYDYAVTEQVPPPPPRPAKDDDLWPGPLFSGRMYHRRETDSRDFTLRVDPASVVVHHVDWVRYRSTTHEVSRHRFEKYDLEF